MEETSRHAGETHPAEGPERSPYGDKRRGVEDVRLMTGLRLTEQLSLAFTSVDDEPSSPDNG